MDGVGISIIERPRPLHNHDTPNPTHHTYTLKCEEPLISSIRLYTLLRQLDNASETSTSEAL